MTPTGALFTPATSSHIASPTSTSLDTSSDHERNFVGGKHSTTPWYRLTVTEARNIANQQGIYRPNYGSPKHLGNSSTGAPAASQGSPSPPRLSPFAAIFHPSVSRSTAPTAPLDLQRILREQGQTLSAKAPRPPLRREESPQRKHPPPSPAAKRPPRPTAPILMGKKKQRHEKGRGKKPTIGLDPLRNPEALEPTHFWGQAPERWQTLPQLSYTRHQLFMAVSQEALDPGLHGQTGLASHLLYQKLMVLPH